MFVFPPFLKEEHSETNRFPLTLWAEISRLSWAGRPDNTSYLCLHGRQRPTQVRETSCEGFTSQETRDGRKLHKKWQKSTFDFSFFLHIHPKILSIFFSKNQFIYKNFTNHNSIRKMLTFIFKILPFILRIKTEWTKLFFLFWKFQ